MRTAGNDRTRFKGTAAALGRVGARGPLLDIDAVAEHLGVTARHVRRLVSERRIPFLKVGKFVRFDPGELDVWLDEQRVAPTRRGPLAGGSWR